MVDNACFTDLAGHAAAQGCLFNEMVKSGRIIIIGDVHGCLDELRELFVLLNPTINDRVFSIGDLIDRGPDSAGVVNFCAELGNTCHFRLVLGNHEEKFLRWLHHVENKTGMESQMKGIDEFPDLLRNLSHKGLNLLRSACYSIFLKRENITLLHGGISENSKFPFPKTYCHGTHSPKELKGLDLITKIRYLSPEGKFVSFNEETSEDRYWAEIYDGAFGHIFFGHQPFLQEKPKEFPHATCLDTGCVFGGWLSAVILENGKRSYISVKTKKTYIQKHKIQK